MIDSVRHVVVWLFSLSVASGLVALLVAWSAVAVWSAVAAVVTSSTILGLDHSRWGQ